MSMGIWIGECQCGAIPAAMCEGYDRDELAQFIGDLVLMGLEPKRIEGKVTISRHKLQCPKRSSRDSRLSGNDKTEEEER